MNDETKCRDIQELLPLMFIGDLRPAEEKVVKKHLKACPSCRESYYAELALFERAAESHPVELRAHPTADVLERYDADRAGMIAEDLAKVEKHLADCQLCREAVEKTAALPGGLDELIAGRTLEITERASETASKVTSLPETRSTASYSRWRAPATWVAAAAILVLALSQFIHKSPQPVAVVEGHFPSVMRSGAEPIRFESQSPDVEFHGSVHVGPEEDHEYNLLVISQVKDSVFFRQQPIPLFDSLGSAHFQARLIPGDYRLVIEDIIPGDTIRIERPFEIQLK